MADNKPNSLLGLDRKAMEEERLRRVARKRVFDEIEMTTTGNQYNLGEMQWSSSLANRFIAADPKLVTLVTQNTAVAHTHEQSNQVNENKFLEYPLGVLKRTWAQGYPRKNDMKIEELLQNHTLKSAVISSWQWDFDWFVTKIDARRTKCIFVVEAKSEAEKSGWLEQFGGLEKSVRLCFPPMGRQLFARMHSKLMLLFHPGHLRLVVPSANPTRHDWGESGLLENLLFVIDLPRLEKKNVIGQATMFQRELLNFLEAMGLPGDVMKGVLNFDFRETADFGFVHSIPGSYGADDIIQSGLAGLSKAVRSLKLEPQLGEQIEVDFAAASVGTLDRAQISKLCISLRGSDPYKVIKGMKSSGMDDEQSASFRLIFPSEASVRRSKGGADAGGTIFLKLSAFENASFPRDIFHEYVSTRRGLLSHNKLILVRMTQNAYLYTGSANLSQSAWGRFSTPKGFQEAQIDITNWECGVLIPVARACVAVDSVLPYAVFEKYLDVPFTCPPKKYDEGSKPWCVK